LLRAGTSIGANIEEARAGQSRPDFISKNAIALKEARETNYWIRLLVAAQLVPESRLSALEAESAELMKIIGAIVVSSRKSKR
jgi:four helix bundle protein